MDKKFKEMMRKAEKIRGECQRMGDGDPNPHAKHMTKMLEYGQKKNLLTGNVMDDSASTELIALTTEAAACVLEVIHNEEVGSVIELSHKEQRKLIMHAKKKAIAHLRSGKALGFLP